jgi:hypothetical protein
MILLTPRKILETKKFMVNHFTDQQIGYLFSLGLVRGKKLHRTTLICVEDVEKIIDFKKEVKKLPPFKNVR